MGTYSEVPDTNQQPRVSCRWVLAERPKGGVLVLKARLVARGYEENDPQLRTDSPTSQKESLRVLMCILVAYNWDLHTIDIKSAYLQGVPMKRTLYMEPPKEAHCTGTVWQLHKCPYGLTDAGRLWYIKVMEVLDELGGKQLRFDLAVFYWHDEHQDLTGVIVIHVDDFIYGGTPAFLNGTIKKIKEVFTVGSEESFSMRYLGMNIAQNKNSITIDTNGYLQALEEIPIKDLGPDKERPLEKTEITALKKLSGQLNWVVSQTRIDVAYESCIIGTSTASAKVKDILYANKAVRKCLTQTIALSFPRNFDIASCKIIAYGDASFANLHDRGSQGGYIIFLTDSDGKYCVLTWQSKRIKRVVRSTLAAECLAIGSAADAAIHLQSTLRELFPRLAAPIHIFSDNDSLVKSVHSSTSVEDKRLQIEVAVLRDMIKQQDVQEIRWIPTKLNLADSLTKAGANTAYLMSVLKGNAKFDLESGAFHTRA